jgi:hypothetical protein
LHEAAPAERQAGNGLMEYSTMERHGKETHVTTEEARAGSTPHIVRYVLGISLFLSIVGLILVWLVVGPSQLP